MDLINNKEKLEKSRISYSILKELRKGNRRVFEKVFNDYYDRLTRFAEGYVFNRQVSEDIVQDFFVWLWENSKTLFVRTTLKAYFYQAIKNRCFDYLKACKVKDKYKLLSLQSILNTSEDELDQDESIEQLRAAIEKLPAEMSKVFKARYYKQLKIEEIAAELEISVSTVKTQLARGKSKLRELIPSCAFLCLL